MPATRTRTKANEAHADSSKPTSRTKSRASNKLFRKGPPKPHVLVNPLPTPPTASRPPADVYVWGKTGFGQLGLGTVVDDILKPRKHPWVAAQVPLGTFGADPGAGIVSVASGGMHTYLLDENGPIWSAGVNDSDNGALGRKSKSDTDDASGKKSGEDPSTSLGFEFGVLHTLVAEGFRAACVVAGDSFGCALDAHGKLRS
ncbi:hypothetical protein D9619_001186 [Psilocybe cf. subviscida]|uniref:Uncharacterized protein n=1 Tax=Psilocybe cf. subviscida TaxID=2480587 RepID=A0A8H5BEN1_9AGAR|nr:hypothetical protein D9619_001186 [Psilocybe cf. subviscida]